MRCQNIERERLTGHDKMCFKIKFSSKAEKSSKYIYSISFSRGHENPT